MSTKPDTGSSNAAGNAGNTLQQTATRMSNRLQNATDRILSPKQRQNGYHKIQQFVNHNPRLAIFLGAQIVFTGIPVIMFALFTMATLLVSLTTCILLGIMAAMAVSFVAIGVALLLLVPTIFVTSCSTTFMYPLGLLSYAVLRRFDLIGSAKRSGRASGERRGGGREGEARAAAAMGNGTSVHSADQPAPAPAPAANQPSSTSMAKDTAETNGSEQNGNGATFHQAENQTQQPENIQEEWGAKNESGGPDSFTNANTDYDDDDDNDEDLLNEEDRSVDNKQDWEEKSESEVDEIYI